jgi:hypothetical protein
MGVDQGRQGFFRVEGKPPAEFSGKGLQREVFRGML